MILHTFEELSSSSEQLVRLLRRAKEEEDWELCKELARFLTALDESGATLMEALEMVNLRSPQDERGPSSFMFEGSRLKVPRPRRVGSPNTNERSDSDVAERSSSDTRSPNSPGSGQEDYFSTPIS